MRNLVKLLLILLMGLIILSPISSSAQVKVGVLFAVHGGFDQFSRQHLWDASAQMFSYEPNHAVYQYALWCPAAWPTFLEQEQALKEIPKYEFEYGRIGGTDPFGMLTQQQLADMINEIRKYTCDVSFEFDWVGWMSGDDPSHYVYPRFIYNKPADWNPGFFCPEPSNFMNYCGEGDNGDPNPWPGCDPQRYNVEGPVERLLNKGVAEIILIDLTVGGMRFSKTYDIYKKVKLCLSDHGQSSMPVKWINDYNDLMQNSYPTDPENWTPQWSYAKKTGPNVDPSVPLSGNPNLITTDPMLTTLNVEGIEAGMNPNVNAGQTGVLLLNHALVDWAEYFDPKIDDAVALNQNIEAALVAKGFNPDNIVGAYMGIKEIGTAEGGPSTAVELTRNMRGENLGYAWLYETNKQLPPGKWGYKYWDALEYLKNRGVQHIVIGFPQIITDSVLQLVEIPNQIGKEIGLKTWLKWGTFDYSTYPGVGHPFADYWGNWAGTDVCAEWNLDYNNGTQAFVLGRTLTGQTSGATGYILAKTGTTATGTLTLKTVTGTFVHGEIIKGSGTNGGSAKANGTQILTVKADCCFTMGGCGDPQRPYPPHRQTAGARTVLDPSLAYDLSDYGHLGYNPALGPPNPDMPVQNQYTGTWEMYKPASARPEVGEMLAKHILNEFECTSTTTTTVPATVINLQDFQAIPGNRKVTIMWTTASEIDNMGFNIYRSSEKDGSYDRINAELIPAKGSPVVSSTYQFTDKPVRNRKTYWYKLEDIDIQGKITMHGPVSAKPGFFAVLSRK